MHSRKKRKENEGEREEWAGLDVKKRKKNKKKWKEGGEEEE